MALVAALAAGVASGTLPSYSKEKALHLGQGGGRREDRGDRKNVDR